MTLGFASSSTGSSDRFRIPWSSFVELVLEITVEAYHDMRHDLVAQQDWEEDRFTIWLTNRYIQPIARRHPLNLIAVSQTEEYTDGMYSGKVSTRTASRIDIRLFQSWMDHNKVYFAWECKRVGDKGMIKEYGPLIPKYVTEGIMRFIDEEYSAGLDDAGMLGYVLAGDVVNIVGDINASMQHGRRQRPLPDSNHLGLAPAVGSFVDVYESNHTRVASQTHICLRHLFLTFDLEN